MRGPPFGKAQTTLPSPEELRARLEELRGERGFLLPHHGALALAAPDLHNAYLRMYEALTLARRHLDPLEKEFTWLAVLIATDESIGTHHIDLFLKAGGTEMLAETATRLAGFAIGARAFAFVDRHWTAPFPALGGMRAYQAGVDALLAERAVGRELADLAMLAVHAALGQAWGTAAHIESGYACGLAEEKLVEAMSLVMWPVGVNRFLDACAVWHSLMASGRVKPSPRFQAWADTPAQGGFDDRGR